MKGERVQRQVQPDQDAYGSGNDLTAYGEPVAVRLLKLPQHLLPSSGLIGVNKHRTGTPYRRPRRTPFSEVLGGCPGSP